MGRGPTAVGSRFRILLIDEAPERARAVETALRAAGHIVVAQLTNAADLAAQVASTGAEVVIIDMNSPDRDTMESLREVSRERPRPILMFVDRSDESMIAEAIGAGVSAYVVDGLNPARVKPKTTTPLRNYNSIDNIAEFFASRGKKFKVPKMPSEAPKGRRGFRPGQKVKHPKYGEGTVYQREGDGEDAKITVQFPRFGLKKLVEKYAQLEKA